MRRRSSKPRTDGDQPKPRAEWIVEGTRSYLSNGFVMRQYSKEGGRILRTGARCQHGRVEDGELDHNAQCKNFATGGSGRPRCASHGGQGAASRYEEASISLEIERGVRVNSYLKGINSEIARKMADFVSDPDRPALEDELAVARGMLAAAFKDAQFNPLTKPEDEAKLERWLKTITLISEKANKIATSEQYVATPEALRKLMSSFTGLVNSSVETAYANFQNDDELAELPQDTRAIVEKHVERVLADLWRRFLVGMDKRGQGAGTRTDATAKLLPPPIESDAIVEGEFTITEP